MRQQHELVTIIKNNIANCKSYDTFEDRFINILNTHASLKSKHFELEIQETMANLGNTETMLIDYTNEREQNYFNNLDKNKNGN